MANYEVKRQKTKKNIIDSAVIAAQSKGLMNITISDIIKIAEINRSTFYRHFDDKFALIECIENNIIEDIKEKYNIFSEYDVQAIEKGNPQKIFMLHFLNIIEKNYNVLSLLLSDKGDFKFNFKLVEFFELIVNKSLNKIAGNDFDDKKKKLFSFDVAVQTIGIITFWVHNFDKYSKEYIYDFMKNDSWK